MQRPAPSTDRTTHRTPRPVDAEQYEGALFHQLASILVAYPLEQKPEMLEGVFACIHEHRLLHRSDHRYGIAGSIEALGRWHTELEPLWRRRWGKLYEVSDRLRPSEEDSAVTIPSQLDYMLMLGIVSDDTAPIARIIRLGMRRDNVGDAAVLLIHAHRTAPIVLQALAEAAATTTTSPEQMLPYQSIKQLTELAAKNPLWYASVLYVGWKPRSRSATSTVPAALVITTPDGQPPLGFPTHWDGHLIETRTATAEELAAWRRLQSNKDAP